MLFAAIATAAEGVKEGVSAVQNAQHPKDKDRAAAAAAALPRAVAGDLGQAEYILHQRFNSADAYGKQQFANAWASLVQQNPGIAQQALQWGQANDTYNTDPGVKSQLLSEYNALVANVRADIGNELQRVGSGLTNAAAGAVDPNTRRFTLPLSSSTLWTLAAIALAIAAIFLLSRKRA